MKNKALLMVVVVGMISGNAFAEDSAGGKEKKPCRCCERMQLMRIRHAERIEQLEEIVATVSAHKESLLAAHLAAREARTALVDAVLTEGDNERAIRRAWRKCAKKTEDSVVAVAAAASSVLAELTPEQRKAIDEMRARLREMHDKALTDAATPAVTSAMEDHLQPDKPDGLGEIIKEAVGAAAKIQSQMTPEQRAELLKMMGKFMSAAQAVPAETGNASKH